jgi:N-6 DNA Methylase.
MVLTWNEIRHRAIEFSHEWKDETRERAEAQTFWNDFFGIFGVKRRRIAVYEKEVELFNEHKGLIDLFWKGTLLVEHKSHGSSLDKAYDQAIGYSHGLKDEELPKYVIVSDFQSIRIYNLDEGAQYWNEFKLEHLVDNIHLFDFIRGVPKKAYTDEDPVNIKAAELMGRLHDALKENGYTGHRLEVFLVRLMFCLFADDTGIFEKDHFSFYIQTYTSIDGRDVGTTLNYIFQTLNTPEDQREKNLDEDMNTFPYINGNLFEELLPTPSFNSKTREILLSCCYFDWSKVSPAIFGTMFQSVIDPVQRRNLGAHYTSEKNILKAIKPLFLDEIWDDFERHKRNKRYLREMLGKIAGMKFFDPACGCGSFLAITYRELRKLSLEVHKQIRRLEGQLEQQVLDIEVFNRDINVDSMYGIELEEFPVQIAKVALWLVDHQMNRQISDEFGSYFARLPLEATPNITQANALEMDWEDLVSRDDISFILGNPPYGGYHLQSSTQKEEMQEVFSGKIKSYGKLDYVSAWFLKAQEYIKGTDIQVAFVSTNSITQGEQVGILWDYLLNESIVINFAHRTFDWSNQSRGDAAVYVVIIGFAYTNKTRKIIYNYKDPFSDPEEIVACNINPYLIDFKNIIIKTRKRTICDIPHIRKGNIPVDGGHLLLSDEEKIEYLKDEPLGEKYIRPLASAKEFLHNKGRWCFWLVDAEPSELRKLPVLRSRIEDVKSFRLASKKAQTKELANQPMLFGEIRQPVQGSYILIPLHTSEHRKYVPMGFLPYDFIVHNSCAIVENATTYHFGVLNSAMHMAWMSHVCGRLESRYRYSNDIVYNNYPWPKNPTPTQMQTIKECVKEVLDARNNHSQASLADLYDPLRMPRDLFTAHKKLDLAVDRCYRSRGKFNSNLERIEFLFDLYDQYTTQ